MQLSGLALAQANVSGQDDKICFTTSTGVAPASTTGNAVSLTNTAGVWDSIYSSSGVALLTGAQTTVTGGGDTIVFSGPACQ